MIFSLFYRSQLSATTTTTKLLWIWGVVFATLSLVASTSRAFILQELPIYRAIGDVKHAKSTSVEHYKRKSDSSSDDYADDELLLVHMAVSGRVQAYSEKGLGDETDASGVTTEFIPATVTESSSQPRSKRHNRHHHHRNIAHHGKKQAGSAKLMLNTLADDASSIRQDALKALRLRQKFLCDNLVVCLWSKNSAGTTVKH